MPSRLDKHMFELGLRVYGTDLTHGRIQDFETRIRMSVAKWRGNLSRAMLGSRPLG